MRRLENPACLESKTLEPGLLGDIARFSQTYAFRPVREFGLPAALAVGAAIFGLASLTDWLDGYLARRRKQVTTLGQIIDPLADKLLHMQDGLLEPIQAKSFVSTTEELLKDRITRFEKVKAHAQE